MKLFVRLVLLSLLISLNGCKNKEADLSLDNLYKFKDYISYNTYGVKSIADPIRIELTQPLEQFDITQEIPAEYIKISPKVAGKLLVENGRSLVFQPNEYLQPDTEYTVSLRLGKLYDGLDKEYKTYTFGFKTITPSFKLDLGNLQSYSKEWQYVTGSIQASDLISLENAKKLISVKDGGPKMVVKWGAEDGMAKYYNFTIDSIQRQVEDSQIQISWSGKSIQSDIAGSNSFQIPGQNNFKVVDLKSTLSPSSVLSINFSDPLESEQNFAGLVAIEKAESLRFEVDGNVLHVYPSNRIVGNVRVSLFTGIKNTTGFGLKSEFSELVSFEQLKPSVRLISNGVILPNATATPLYFEAVNLKAVDVNVVEIFEDNMLQFLQSANLNNYNSYEIRRVGRRIAKKTVNLDQDGLSGDGLWKSYGINLSEYFTANPGSLYRVELSFKPEYTTYNCGNSTDDEGDLAIADDISDEEDELEEEYWDNLRYNYRRYNYNWEERDNPCHDAYYNEDRFVRTNVMGSDLGLIVKKGDNRSYHFATTNLLTTDPEAGTTIRLYNYQQQLIGTSTTDQQGLTIIDSEKLASFAVAQKGPHYAYAKLEDGNALSLSKFDVSGKKLEKGLKGFLYTERGVHRPGDSIHLTFVLNDRSNPLPKNHPVKLEVTDARGKLVQRTVTNQNAAQDAENGFYYFPIATQAASPTGNWYATVSVGGAEFGKTLKVATVKPNRLKINLDFDDDILDATKAVTGTATSLWLHGAPARNLKIEMEATLRSTQTSFPKFSGFTFNDPIRNFDEIEIPFLQGNLSESGSIDFDTEFDISGRAPGMLKATFLTKVFEGGGDFSVDVFSKDLAPYSHFAGLRSPKARQYGSYFTDENTTFDVASVDAQGKAAGGRKLQVKIFQIEWRWWWNRGRDNLSRYENATVHRPVQEFEVTTQANGQGSFTVNIPENDGGRYLIRVIDPASGHSTGRVTYFYRNWWKRPASGDAESARMLVFSADKESYQVGEEAVITFPSGGEGRALISVENGSEVLSTTWAKTEQGETQVRIPITTEMAPNVFVNISLLQPHVQTQNDLPIRLYGVVPIGIENEATQLEPTLAMADELRPESIFDVTVSEANNKPMTYTLAMVDEGLLDLTRFPTPKIHQAFYARQALGVKTFDIFDDVIGAYSGSVDNIYAVGGGDEAAGAKNRKADRFKPVVKYLGPFTLRAGEKQTHELMMPNYVGSVRTMVIAGDNTSSAYGATDKTTPVRKPLMVLASLPRKLSPGETVTLPVTVFAMDSKIKQASISVEAGSALKAVGPQRKTLSFSEVGEQIVNFEFEVLPASEFQTIKVNASGHGESASYEVEIDVENPNPITQKTTLYTLAANESQTVSFDTFGVAGSNGATLEISTLPPMNFSKRMEYLIRYPHGCIEQTTSGAFPQLFLDDIFDITFDKKQQIENNVKAAIKRLGNFQTANGGLSYWPGERSADEWGTNYAGHFMLEAKNSGYALPITFLSNWLRYQKTTARQWQQNATAYNSSLTQAYRLYTLALAGQPELAAMNRLRSSRQLSNDAKWRLAAAYALAGKKQIANEIAQSANIVFTADDNDRYTYGSPFRNKAMALETMALLGDQQQREMAISVSKELSSSRWYSTQETAYALLAMAKMVEKNGGKSVALEMTLNNESETITSERALVQRELNLKSGTNSMLLKNSQGNVVYVTLAQKGKLPLGEELADKRNFNLKLQYYDNNDNPIDVTSLRQGTEITAKVVLTNTSNDFVKDVALSQIFPSGWEIVNTSFTELGGGADGNARYKDIRDDRVNFYFDIKARSSKTFTVKLNASYLGRYYLPGVQAEAMYDNNYYARSKGQWIQVTQ